MSTPWFESAVEAEAEDYVAAETALRDAVRDDPEQRAAVIARLDDPDPVARLVAGVVLSDADLADSQVGQVEDYLARAQRWYARTPALLPPVPGVVAELAARFGTQLGELFALRLAKGASTEPWREAVSLAYLTRHPTPAATEALLRYAATTSVPQLQTAAARAIVAGRDRDLRRKVAAESSRLAGAGRSLPAAVIAALA